MLRQTAFIGEHYRRSVDDKPEADKRRNEERPLSAPNRDRDGAAGRFNRVGAFTVKEAL